jgi:hypothetical protein
MVLAKLGRICPFPLGESSTTRRDVRWLGVVDETLA